MQKKVSEKKLVELELEPPALASEKKADAPLLPKPEAILSRRNTEIKSALKKRSQSPVRRRS
jgi:hypothetical protein